MSDESTITKKGQITIPRKLRDEFNLKPGKKVFFVKSEDGVLIKPVVENVRSLRGILNTEATSDEIQDEIRSIRKEWSFDND
ncbi:MAG: AbrB/MazE/SpoVT family DNA-binding domain-containing protein [Candidatus Hodarchaeales archaeon]